MFPVVGGVLLRFQTPLVGLVLLVMTSVGIAAPVRDNVIVPEDYLDIASITSLAVSPDGQQAVWTESRWGWTASPDE